MRNEAIEAVAGHGKWCDWNDQPGVQLVMAYPHPTLPRWAELVVWEGETTALSIKRGKRRATVAGVLYPDRVFWDGYEMVNGVEVCRMVGQTAATMEQLVADAEAWVESADSAQAAPQ